MHTGFSRRAKWLGILLTVCVVALFGACQGGSGVSSPDITPPATGQTASLQQVLADLDALSAPPDVDQALFEELKSALSAALANLGEQRFVSIAPSSDLSAVTDFSIQGNEDDSASLSWTYMSQGDYDQNSEVNVADLTPVVINFGANPGGGNWANSSVADGDGNDEVNLSDITPIAINFQRTVSGYRVYSSLTPFEAGSWVATGTDIPFSVGVIPPGLSRRAFEYTLPNPEGEVYYRVAPYHNDDVGMESNFQQFTARAIAGAPEGLTATNGTLVDEVELSWLPLDGANAYMVERRLGQVGDFVELGLALPGQTEYSNITVVAGEVYQYRVKGINGDRESAYSGVVEGWPMRIPTSPLNLEASDGTSAVSVDLAWDGDAEATEYVIYRSTESGSGHVEIDRTGELTYSDTTATTEFIYYYQIASSNAVGESAPGVEDDGWVDGYVFPPVIDSVDPTSGVADSSITFSITTSGGAIDTYSWDFGGGAVPDMPTDESPTVTLGETGTYNASVTVANVNGEDTLDFELTVGSNEWVHTWGTAEDDITHGLGVDDAGNVYIIGRPGSNNAADLNVIKFDPFGEVVWAKTITPAQQPFTFSAEVDGSGNVYIGGGFEFNSGLAMVKLNTDGEVEWQRYTVINPLNRIHVAVDSAGMAYFCADSDDIGGDGYNFLLMKFNPAGDAVWKKFIKNNGKEGGPNDDFSMTSLIPDDANNLYITAAEGRILKLDSDGNGLWQKAWTTGAGNHLHTYSSFVDGAGNIYLGGDGDDGGDYRTFVVKFNSAGGLQFQTGFLLDGIPSGSTGFDNLYLDAENNIWGMISNHHFMGGEEPYSHLVKLDQTGAVTGHWSFNNTGSKPGFWDFEVNANGSFYFAGIDDNNQGTWEVATNNIDPFTGQVDDEPFEIADAINSIENSIISSRDADGILDIGGGGDDMLVIKLDPNSLP